MPNPLINQETSSEEEIKDNERFENYGIAFMGACFVAGIILVTLTIIKQFG